MKSAVRIAGVAVSLAAGSGLLVVALCKSLAVASGVAKLIGIEAAAWLVGFVVPGAPGGLGVREAVLIAGLSAAGLLRPRQLRLRSGIAS